MVASPRRKRIYSITFMLMLAVLATLVGMLVPVSPTEAQLISDQLNKTVSDGTASGTLSQMIFVNNFSLCLLMFVPLAGAGIGLFILFNTGQAFRAIFEIQAANGALNASAAAEMTATTAILTLALVGVVFLLEYVSYTIAMTESVWLFRRLLQNKWRGELKYLLIFIGLVTLFLVVGAVVENFTIAVGA